jgi:hypothetical protein
VKKFAFRSISFEYGSAGISGTYGKKKDALPLEGGGKIRERENIF